MSPASSPGSPLELTDVLARLMDLGPPSEIRAQSPRMAANVLGLDRVLLSSIRSGTLTPAAVHDSTRDSAQVLVALRKRTVRLEYPLIEGEIMRQRRPRIVGPPGIDVGRSAAG